MFVPTGFKPLKFILLMENLLSIYRNLAQYSRRRRFIAYFQIVFEFFLSISSAVVYTIYILPTTTINDFIFYYTNILNSLITILLSIYYCKKFNKLLLLIENNNLYFSNDTIYKRNLTRRDIVIKGVYVCFIAIIILSGFFGSYVRNKAIKHVALNVFFTLNSRLSDCRNVFQYVALYTVLYVISQQLECITRVVRKKWTSVTIVREQNDNINNVEYSETRQTKYDFEELSTVFSDIAECSKLFNQIYGLQMVFMLGWATVYCIMFLYTSAFLSLKGFHDVGKLLGSLWRLLVFLLLLLLISQSAQKKQNNVRDLRRQLGKLLVICIDHDEEYNATKDFLSLVSTRCIQTKTFGSIDVDMTLIPSIIMFITSYTVIALQFSNIV